MNKCTKPDCDCLEIAIENNGGTDVKSYPCLAGSNTPMPNEFKKEKIKIENNKQGSDAVEFAEFILADYEMVATKRKGDTEEMSYWQLAGTYQNYTTEELYDIFKTKTVQSQQEQPGEK